MAREQRKLAAILAAGIVGYSRLMGRDESGSLARLADISLRIVAALPGSPGARVPILHDPRQQPTRALYSQAMIDAGATE